jgi:SAM-dependent methyltransferase
MDRDAQFKHIKAYFDKKDREGALKGKLPLGSTEKGFWGTAHLDDVYEFCKRIELEKEAAFLDLGSGDGRVVLVAALFTHAVGIEYDRNLHEQALAAAKELESTAQFVCGDYTQYDLSEYTLWFSYADHNFNWLEAKQHELTKLYLYHDTFHPHFLAKGKITWVGQIPIFLYTKTTGQE